jgi:hypothetical protein
MCHAVNSPGETIYYQGAGAVPAHHFSWMIDPGLHRKSELLAMPGTDAQLRRYLHTNTESIEGPSEVA